MGGRKSGSSTQRLEAVLGRNQAQATCRLPLPISCSVDGPTSFQDLPGNAGTTSSHRFDEVEDAPRLETIGLKATGHAEATSSQRCDGAQTGDSREAASVDGSPVAVCAEQPRGSDEPQSCPTAENIPHLLLSPHEQNNSNNPPLTQNITEPFSQESSIAAPTYSTLSCCDPQ